jgi:Fe-S-cluster containining protein
MYKFYRILVQFLEKSFKIPPFQKRPDNIENKLIPPFESRPNCIFLRTSNKKCGIYLTREGEQVETPVISWEYHLLPSS